MALINVLTVSNVAPPKADHKHRFAQGWSQSASPKAAPDTKVTPDTKPPDTLGASTMACLGLWSRGPMESIGQILSPD